ncbi:MBL fold metallo-hydrolase [Candidatus Microgenomates bacterium]|nr:MBL fold metallo-hydrolase [Candidatus Microgenomates bacterium]
MDITWLGHASFRIRGKSVTVVTDPFAKEMVGLSMPRVTADIATVSHEHKDHNNVEGVAGIAAPPKVIRAPGEYEVRGVNIRGVKTWHDVSDGRERGNNIIFVIELDNIRLAHLGDLGHKLSEEQVSEIGDVHILLVPVGGFYTIGPETAAQVVAQIEPKVVIPMHYQIPGLLPEVFEKLQNVEEFVKVLGITPKHMPSYQAKPDTIPEEMELVILERKS